MNPQDIFGKKPSNVKLRKCLNVFFSSVICTLPEFELASNCRGCSEGPNKWRCDNGLCIDSKLVKNGIQDCHDGSDENTGMSLISNSNQNCSWLCIAHFVSFMTKELLLLVVFIKWWAILFITMAVSLLGILASYFYREACRRVTIFIHTLLTNVSKFNQFFFIFRRTSSLVNFAKRSRKKRSKKR